MDRNEAISRDSVLHRCRKLLKELAVRIAVDVGLERQPEPLADLGPDKDRDMLVARCLVLVINSPVVHDLVSAALEDEADKGLELQQRVASIVCMGSSLFPAVSR